MNKEQAKIYFTWNEEEHPLDQWEEHLFKVKQYFLNNLPIGRVFNAKLEKLKKSYEAYLLLGGVEVQKLNKLENTFNIPKYSNVLSNAFNQLFDLRNVVKQKILEALHPDDLDYIIRFWIAQEISYQALFTLNDLSFFEDNVVVSKADDPMVIYQSMKEAEATLGDLNFENLNFKVDFLPKVLKKEVKRLNLLRKYE